MKRKNRFFANGALILMLAAIVLISVSFIRDTPRILVFTKTNGFVHTSIPAGVKAIQALGIKHGFACDVTNDSLQFNYKNLSRYDAVVFLSTTGDVLGDAQQEDFKKYIASGKGFVGIHAATDTEYGWPWYNELVGAQFKSHPEQQIARLDVRNRDFIATKHLPENWSRKDEWYNFKNTHWNHVNVLITIDESSIKGGENGSFHPMSWYRDFAGGRSFYTALGHTDESYQEEAFLEHLAGGIHYAIGSKK